MPLLGGVPPGDPLGGPPPPPPPPARPRPRPRLGGVPRLGVEGPLEGGPPGEPAGEPAGDAAIRLARRRMLGRVTGVVGAPANNGARAAASILAVVLNDEGDPGDGDGHCCIHDAGLLPDTTLLAGEMEGGVGPMGMGLRLMGTGDGVGVGPTGTVDGVDARPPNSLFIKSVLTPDRAAA